MTRHIPILTLAMAAVGLWAFVLAGSGPVLAALVGASYAAGVTAAFRGRPRLPARAANLAAIPVFALLAVDYLLFSGDILVSGSRLLAVLLSIKLFDLKSGRDYMVAYALVFFQVLAAAASTVSVAFFALLAVHVMASIWAMMVFSTLREMKAAGVKAGRGRVFGPGLLATVAALTALSLAVTLALFFFMPRVGVGFFHGKRANAMKVSGFSDTVDLGSLGPVKEDRSLVMRVEFPSGRPATTVYFKGTNLVEYDGRSWSRERARSFIKRGGPEGFFIGPGRGRSTEFSVLLEPIDAEVLFTVPNVYRLEGPFQAIWVERSGVIRLPSPPFTRVSYRGWTDLSRVISDEPGPGGPTADRYLSASREGARIAALAREIAPAGTALEKARAIESYLEANYRYTLSPGRKGGDGPLEDFLFYSKEGYCEHFATAMAMLLRASGIPSRLATGFLEGEWNELGGYFMVRQQDAHSWVEAWIEGDGWTRFDPTPGAAVAPLRPSALSLYLDLLRLRWDRYIIQFSFSDQRRMAFAAERTASEVFARIKESLRQTLAAGAGPDPAYAAAAAALLALGLLLWRRRAVNRARPGGRGFYAEMLRALAQQGLEKMPSETPAEFARRSGDSRVMFVTGVFQEERYAGRKAAAAQAQRARALVREIRKGRGR